MAIFYVPNSLVIELRFSEKRVQVNTAFFIKALSRESDSNLLSLVHWLARELINLEDCCALLNARCVAASSENETPEKKTNGTKWTTVREIFGPLSEIHYHVLQIEEILDILVSQDEAIREEANECAQLLQQVRRNLNELFKKSTS